LTIKTDSQSQTGLARAARAKPPPPVARRLLNGWSRRAGKEPDAEVVMSFELSVQWQLIYQTEDGVDVVEREELRKQPDACIPLGTAPDGLPLVLSVQRSASIVEPALRALHAPDLRSVSEPVRAALESLDALVQDERRGLGIIHARAPDGRGRDRSHYVSMGTVPNMAGGTLLTRMLGAASPLLLPEDHYSGVGRVDQRDVRTSCGVLMDAAERVRVTASLGRQQHFAVPLDEGPTCVVTKNADGTFDPEERRPFAFEDLRWLRSAAFHAYTRTQGVDRVERFQGAIGNTAEYRRALLRADAVGWSVTRQDLLRLVAELARSLVPRHREGFVHADIKPANVLITRDGPVAHDPLDVKIGAISAAGSKGWNAPEQIIARPVSPATDVFALAQLIVQILEAAVFGDERAFVVPVGRGERLRARMLAEPDVYLDPSLTPMSDAAIAAWRGFLRKCLAFDADERVQSASLFADELMTIAETHPLKGRRVVSGLAGQLTRVERGIVDRLLRIGRDEVDTAVVWMLSDSYRYVGAEPWRKSIMRAA
jgi:hypothetical protein